eukprot:jgi/Bigna1/66387/fgenesh1_pg.1_\
MPGMWTPVSLLTLLSLLFLVMETDYFQTRPSAYRRIEARTDTVRRRRRRGDHAQAAAIRIDSRARTLVVHRNRLRQGRDNLQRRVFALRGGVKVRSYPNSSSSSSSSSEEDEEYLEAEHFNSVLRCFRRYTSYMNKEISRRENAFLRLPPEQKALLPGGNQSFTRKISLLKKLVLANQMFFDDVISGLSPRKVELTPKRRQRLGINASSFFFEPTGTTNLDENTDKVLGTLHLLARDWSASGAQERKQSYSKIMHDLRTLLPPVATTTTTTSSSSNNSSIMASSNGKRGRSITRRRKVLIPGVGLGRLLYECWADGYDCEGNEFCWQLLLTSRLVLNANLPVGQYVTFPYIDNPIAWSIKRRIRSRAREGGLYITALTYHRYTGSGNQWSPQECLRPIRIPDVDMYQMMQQQQQQQQKLENGEEETNYHELDDMAMDDINNDDDDDDAGEKDPSKYAKKPCPQKLKAPEMSMTAGEFLQMYGDPRYNNSWDAIVTCFFLDTAPNVIEYISAFHRLLRPGGIWINLGPLTYHWQSSQSKIAASILEDSRTRSSMAAGMRAFRFGESLELSLSEILHVSRSLGFQMVKGPHRQECRYACDESTMKPTIYNASYFVMTKT